MATATAERIVEVARRLFAQKGFDGVSVREICREASVSGNAVHYHFGSKVGLYRSILGRFVDVRLDAAERLLGGEPATLDELRLRLELFCDETLGTLLVDRDALVITLDEMGQGFPRGGEEAAAVIGAHERGLTAFLEAARRHGLLRDDVDLAIVAGTLLERVSTQARYVDFHAQLWGTTPRDAAYRRHWIRQVVDMCLFGAATSSEEGKGS